MEHESREFPLESKAVLPLISVGKGRTSSLQRWVGVHGTRLERPEQLPRQWVEGGEEGFDKALREGGSCPSPLENLTDIQCSISTHGCSLSLVARKAERDI